MSGRREDAPVDPEARAAAEAAAQPDPSGGRGRNGRGGRRRRLLWIAAAVAVVAALAAWFLLAPQPLFGMLADREGGSQSEGGRGPVPVQTLLVAPETVPIYLDYTGTTVAVREIEIRPQVSGYLVERGFEEGEDVEAGRVLYRIDPRPIRARLNEALAAREAQRAQLDYAQEQVARLRPLVEQRAVAETRLDEFLRQEAQARATLREVEARIASARLDLEYTSIEAPFAGRVGFARAEVGAWVARGGGPLTDLARIDPIFVRFQPSEKELPRIQTRLREARREGRESLPVKVSLAGDQEWELEGSLVQIDNQIDRSIGAIVARAVLPNEARELLPGRFARVRLILERREALLVPIAALGTDQARRVLHLMTPEGRVEVREVQAGRFYGERVRILEGLAAGERVITSNLQRIRGGAKVVPAKKAAKGDGGSEAR